MKQFIWTFLCLTALIWLPVHAEKIGVSPDFDVLQDDDIGLAKETTSLLPPQAVHERQVNVTGENAYQVAKVTTHGKVTSAGKETDESGCSGCHGVIGGGSSNLTVTA